MTMPGNPAYHVYRWIWGGIDWLYPPHCGGCGTPGSRWCEACEQNSQLIKPPICQRCGIEIKYGTECNHCHLSPPKFEALRSWAVFSDPVRKAIHRLKYSRDIAMGESLARPLCDCFRTLNWEIDIVVPVPLGIARKKERGYNQADLLAYPFALTLKLCYEPKALIRARETDSQVGLSLNDRRSNVEEAFIASEAYVRGRTILVVDDVATSGATLDACAQALLKSGAEMVYCITLARAL